MNSPAAWKSFPELKVVVIGDSGAGKTSIVVRYCRGEFSIACTSTIGASFLKQLVTASDGSEIELQIWDTAGQERFQALGPLYYRGAKVAIIVFDITKCDALQKVMEWHKGLIEANKNEKLVVLVGNKTDLDESRLITRDEAESCAEQIGATYFETSAKNNQGISDLFTRVTEMAAEMKLENIDRSVSSIEFSPSVENSNAPGKEGCAC